MNDSSMVAVNLPASEVSFREAARVWAKIGWLGFGGPAGQIALMHRELVEKRHWISEARFLHALNYCMLLPGPEAKQLATYIGWLLHRTRGGIIAGALFVLPGVLAILLLSMLYTCFDKVPAIAALFFGLKAAVLAVVVEAVVRIGRRALKSLTLVLMAAGAFIALFFFSMPFPWVIASAALIGTLASVALPAKSASEQQSDAERFVIDRMYAQGQLDHAQPSTSRALRVAFLGLLLWSAPLMVVALILGSDHVVTREGLFFSRPQS